MAISIYLSKRMTHKISKKFLSKPVDYLFSFKTSIIVAPHLLKRVRRYAVNIHGGTPEFPGRDPHHFAVYHGAKLFGATAHFMNDLVDSRTNYCCENLSCNATLLSREIDDGSRKSWMGFTGVVRR